MSDIAVAEGGPGTASVAAFVVARSGDASEDVQVTVATADRTAVAGSDREAVGPTVVTFAPGVIERTVVVNLTGDAADEPDETFNRRLTKPVRTRSSMRPAWRGSSTTAHRAWARRISRPSGGAGRRRRHSRRRTPRWRRPRPVARARPALTR